MEANKSDMMRNPRSTPAVRTLPVVLAALVVIACTANSPEAMAQGSVRIGDTLPQASVTDLGGRPMRLPSDVMGKVVILHFWANGCSSCREEMQAMESLQAKYAKRGLVILAVNVGQRKETVRAFVAGLNLTYPILIDPDRDMARKYDVVGVPKTFIMDRNGQIRYRIVGWAGKVSLNKLVNSLL